MSTYYMRPMVNPNSNYMESMGHKKNSGDLLVYDFGNGNYYVANDDGEFDGMISSFMTAHLDDGMKRCFCGSPKELEQDSWNIIDIDETNRADKMEKFKDVYGGLHNSLFCIEAGSLEEALKKWDVEHTGGIKEKSWKEENIKGSIDWLVTRAIGKILGNDRMNDLNLRNKLSIEIFGSDLNNLGNITLEQDILDCSSAEELKDKVEAKAKKILEESTENQ